MKFLAELRNDILSIRRRDPAARSALDILLCYPTLHAVWMYRVAHWLWNHKLRLAARWLSQVVRVFTGVEIHPGARIGSGFFIDHGVGVVIGETAEVGADVTLFHGVTLGGTSLLHGKRHPTLGDRVVVGAGAKLLGAIHIGDDCRIGANAVVAKSVPANSVVVGVPGRPVVRSHAHTPDAPPDFQHTVLPDMIAAKLKSLTARVDHLEKEAAANGRAMPTPRPARQEAWEEEFCI
jgi:serine O-acetyltransferase